MKIAVLLAVMAAMTGIAVGEEIIDPVLWVVPDSPDRYLGANTDFVLEEIVIDDVNMGNTFSGNVLVIYKAGTSNTQCYGNNCAQNVYLKFFVKSGDQSNINNIQVGTAQLIGNRNINLGLPNDANPSPQTLTFGPVAMDSPVPAGYGVSYLIGDIPFKGDNPTYDIGDPQINLNTFYPYNAQYLVRVPFTINFNTQPAPGFVLYTYAENTLSGVAEARTAYSHDGGFYNQIPEFSTIAIPIAAVLGLVFFFQQRKKKEE
jgi:hypothetical protein